MASVNCEQFSSNDLRLFIESLEKISALEKLKQERKLQKRARYLVETLRYLDQQYPTSYSKTLSSPADPEYETITIEEKEILSLDMVQDMIYDSLSSSASEDEGIGSMESNEYDEIDTDRHEQSYIDALYSNPMNCLESTKISECPSDEMTPIASISSSVSYDEPHKVIKKKSLKKRLFQLIRQTLKNN